METVKKTDIEVLIIDDEKISIEEVRESVRWEKTGIDPASVFEAGSVRQAQRFLSSHLVDIIICDIEMPGENGLDFVEWLTEWARLESGIECIMLTCHPEFEYLRRALRLGCLDYLLKPLEAEEMEKTLIKAVSNIRKRQTFRHGADVPPESGRREDVIYGKVIPYIDAHLAESFSVELLAEQAALNPQYLMRLFKKETGHTILVYVTNKRVEAAKEYLEKTSLSIEEITEKVGYYSSAHLSSVFKRVTGISPGQYRKTHQPGRP